MGRKKIEINPESVSRVQKIFVEMKMNYGVRYSDVATALDTSHTSIYDIFHGKTALSPQNAKKLAEFYEEETGNEVKPEWLLAVGEVTGILRETYFEKLVKQCLEDGTNPFIAANYGCPDVLIRGADRPEYCKLDKQSIISCSDCVNCWMRKV